MSTQDFLNKADRLVDRAADRMREFADRAAVDGGVKAKLADELADDAAFLRNLKPSLIVARAKGEAPTGMPSGSVGLASPSPPPPRATRKGEGPNPLLVVGAALVAGIVIAKLIDMRGHAHPRY
ncbi:MAG: hypothetical protein ACRDNP_05350 [Gaiellaceae bacterium]